MRVKALCRSLGGNVLLYDRQEHEEAQSSPHISISLLLEALTMTMYPRGGAA